MTAVAEVQKLDDVFEIQRLARLLVGPDGRIDVLELQPGGADLARVLLDEIVVDPFGRRQTQNDGQDFLRALSWGRSSDRLWITPPVELPDGDARDPGVELPAASDWDAPATVPYPTPPDALAGVRVAEIRTPDPDDYRLAQVVARLVEQPERSLRVEGTDPVSGTTIERLLEAIGRADLERLDGAVLAPGLVVAGAPFDRPGDRAWRDALVRARAMALRAGDDDALTRLDLEYMTRLPRVWLSRCPFTGEVLRLALDGWGFDGPFWDPARPVRPLDDLPSSFVGLAGAVVEGDVDGIPTEAVGARRAPLFPSVVEGGTVRPVLSATRVGGRRCDVVAYFAQPRPAGPPGFREWGTRHARVLKDRSWRWADRPPADPSVATHLRPWLESGRLWWIAPFDLGVELRSGPQGCPWLAAEEG